MSCSICREPGHNRRTCSLVRTIQPLDSIYNQIILSNGHHEENIEYKTIENIDISPFKQDNIITSPIQQTYDMEFPIIQLNAGYTNTNLDISEVVDLIRDRNAIVCCMVEVPSKKKAYKILEELNRQTEGNYDMICEKVGYEYISIIVDKNKFNADENYEVNYQGRFINTGLTRIDTGEHIDILTTHFPRSRKNKSISLLKGKIGDDRIFTGDFNCNPDVLKYGLTPYIINLALKNDENPTTSKGRNAIDNIGSIMKQRGRIISFNDVEVEKSSVKTSDHFPVIANVCTYVR